jgi:hypothetical protein
LSYDRSAAREIAAALYAGGAAINVVRRKDADMEVEIGGGGNGAHSAAWRRQSASL